MADIDLMEYSSNVLAQNAYVTNDPISDDPDFLSGGTASADSEYDANYIAIYGCDNDTLRRWSSTDTSLPHWWK